MNIYYPGVWDLFHIGHLNALKSCMIDPKGIIVGICSDELNLCLKGTTCVYNENQRASLIESIKGVKDVIIYNDTQYHNHLENMDIFVCGPEFGEREDQKRSLRIFENMGVSIFRTDRTPNISTTELKERIKQL